MPKLIGAINDVVRDNHEVEFALSTDEALIFLPEEFMDCKERQWKAQEEEIDPAELNRELLFKYHPSILELVEATKYDIHLIINSPGGNTRIWSKYDRALKQLQSEGSTITTHTLTRAEALAGDIFLRAQHHTALEDSSFTFSAGDFDETEYMCEIVQFAAEENLEIKPFLLQDLIAERHKRANKEWTNIRQFLLANPEATGHSRMMEQITSAEKEKDRQLTTSGKELRKAGAISTTHSTVREMFESFCNQTHIPFDTLPMTFVSESFTIAAAEEAIHEETGIWLRLAFEGDGNGSTTLSMFTKSIETLQEKGERIEEIIHDTFLAQEFAKKECDN